jgi:C-terminal processing protease CtpA/Prc
MKLAGGRNRVNGQSDPFVSAKMRRCSLGQKVLIVSLLLAFAAPARFGAFGRSYDPEKKIPLKNLKEDLLLMHSALREAHGAIDRYTPLSEWERQFDAALAALDRPMGEREFYLLLAPLVAAIGCGHTTIHPSLAWREHMRKKMPLFPFKLRFIAGRAYAQRNYSQFEKLGMGSEVTAINGMPMAEILSRMLAMITADAGIQTGKLIKLESSVYFGTWYNLLFGKTNEYETVLRPQDGTPATTVKAAGITAADLNAVFTRRYPVAARIDTTAPIKLEYTATGQPVIAILTIYTFNVAAYKETGINYSAFLNGAIREIRDKDVRHLLIDLRYNNGGDDAFGKILAAHLLDKPFPYYQTMEVRSPNFSFWEFTNRPDSVKNLAAGIRRNERGGYDVLGHPNLGWQQPQLPLFTGKVWVLLNGGTFSSAGECASVLHFKRRARFIGSESGSGYFGNTSGLGLALTLPRTGIRVGIPLCKVTMAVSDHDPRRGILPEIPFQPSPADVLLETDVELAFALKAVLKEAQGE